jgi:hypothetical protein
MYALIDLCIYCLFMCRLTERLRRWMLLSEQIGSRQHLVPAEPPTESVPQPAEVNSFASCEDLTNRGEGVESQEVGAVGGDGGEQIAGKSGHPETLPRKSHPDFPLLPMSKGFRLSLHKLLTRFEDALKVLKETEMQTTDTKCAADNGEVAEANETPSSQVAEAANSQEETAPYSQKEVEGLQAETELAPCSEAEKAQAASSAALAEDKAAL